MPAHSNMPRIKRSRRQPTFAPGFPRFPIGKRSSRARPVIRKAVKAMKVSAKLRRARKRAPKIKQATRQIIKEASKAVLGAAWSWEELNQGERTQVRDYLIEKGYAM